jgi:26S proteasome regulatory subunit N7
MDPLLQGADLLFTLRRGTSDDVSLETTLFKELVVEHEMLGLLQNVSTPLDETLKTLVEGKVQSHHLALEQTLEEAKEKHGQVEIVEAQLALASHWLRTSGDFGKVQEYWSRCDLKNLSSGKRIDAHLERARFGLAWEDYGFTKQALDECTKLLTVGGDWDRRNRLKVYDGVLAMCTRNFHSASKEFLSCITTFTAEEVFSYDRFILYAMLVGVVSLERIELKSKIVSCPEVVAVLDSCFQTHTSSYLALSKRDRELKQNCATVGRFVQALYDCQYRTFMEELIQVHALLLKDRFLARHAQWFLKEMRIKAYEQFLASYKSVTLERMAKAFGVSVSFLDEELSKFIAQKRLTAKIDKVSNVVETNRPDLVNFKYQAVIKQGDLLLTRVQMLSRVINV